ncbi:MAG: HNH endonuclease [Hyphomicrobiales bacterium]|nr:HNH endonuclease [Hyphomicrobiales bacterium]
MAERQNWSTDEVRHALALYLRTDFGRLHRRNPDIVDLAKYLGRTPGALALKLVNLAALDTSIPQRGMSNVSKIDKQVWADFLADPDGVLKAYQYQTLQFPLSGNTTAQQYQAPGMADVTVEYNHAGASEKRVETTQRIGQEFFRKIILTSYRERCAVTGIEDKRLLNASHIVAWKDDLQNRINPTNGICLNALHDRAFDRHLITFDEDYCMKIAPHVPVVARRELERVETGRLELPKRFMPDQRFLEKHRREFFELVQ